MHRLKESVFIPFIRSWLILMVQFFFVVLFLVSMAAAMSLSVDPRCSVPPYSINLHEVNLTAENEAILLTEGECYLGCLANLFDFQVNDLATTDWLYS